MGDIHAICTADAVCGSHAFEHNFQLFVAQRCTLCQKFQVSHGSPNRYSILIAVIPLSH
jgi:hypothetical protein